MSSLSSPRLKLKNWFGAFFDIPIYFINHPELERFALNEKQRAALTAFHAPTFVGDGLYPDMEPQVFRVFSDQSPSQCFLISHYLSAKRFLTDLCLTMSMQYSQATILSQDALFLSSTYIPSFDELKTQGRRITK